MLSVVASYLVAKLNTLRYIQKKYGMGVIVNAKQGDDDIRFPAVYEGSELVNINYDNFRSMCYILPDGKISRSTEEHSALACTDLITETYPLKLIIYSQTKEAINCESVSQNITWGVGQLFSGKQRTLETTAGYENVNITVKNINANKNEVWSEQFSVDSRLKDTDILLSIEFEVETRGVQSCYVVDPCEPDSLQFDIAHATLCERIDDCLASNNETLTVDIVAGSNTFAHTLGAVPDMISFWKDNYLWLINFDTQLTASSVIINSTDNFDDITIKLLKF